MHMPLRSLGLSLALSLLLAAGTLDAQPASKPTGALADGLAALAVTDYPKAESELAKVKGAGEPEAQLGLARAALEQGKLADAEKYANLAGANAAFKVRAAAMWAEVLLAQGKNKDAIALLEQHKSAKDAEGRRVRLLLGEALIASGKRADADAPLKKIADDYDAMQPTDAEGLATVGRAAALLRYPKDANRALGESEKADKKRVETMLWRAELFLDKYDPGHAEEMIKDVLKIAPKRGDALVMLARVKLDQTLDFDDAEKLVKEALAVNPKHVGAFAVRAGLALRDMDIAGAEKAIADGLAVNPNDLGLLSLKAATRFLDDDPNGFETQKKEVLARNAQFSSFYRIVGEYAEWEHRYDDIVSMMGEAVKLDPNDGKAWAELGLTQMRNGDETNGFKSIQKAWSKDTFNVRVFNTLNMYEKQIPTDYEMGTEGVFKIRYAKDERPVMERYVPRLLGEAFASMKARYGFVPKTPVQVEMYASREIFSVRTSGLPNIGIQGVCFGGVIAAISPKAEPFNWGNVIWHELGHVFAIQMSKNHVPRWFTEGLSEYETIARRPEWARELDPELYQAITNNKLPGAVDMNRAFTHANDAADVTVAYYAASQMMVWTVEKFGMKSVVKALELWGQGKKTPDVIKGAFGVTPAEYDKGFRDWALARLGRYKTTYVFTLKGKQLEEAKKFAADHPNDAKAQTELALSLVRARKGKEAKAALENALKLDAKNPDANYVAARIAIMEKDLKKAEHHLDAIRAAGKDGFSVRMLLAEIAEEQKDKDKMRFHMESAHRLDPSQAEPLKGLFDMANEDNREDDALDALRKLARLEQHDRKVWRMLLDKLVAKKAWDEARKVGEGAVFVDVMGGPTHVLYSRALAAQNAHDKAAYELETALLTNMKDKENATVHALLAQSYVALKRTADAQKEKDAALKIDPENAEAKNIKLP